MASLRNPFDAPPIRAQVAPGEVDPTGELQADRPDPLSDADAAPPDPPGKRLAVAFVGDGLAYTRLWFAGMLLSVLTLGLYSPWAAVAKRRYLAAHTLIGGVPLVYHGTPSAILRGRLLVTALLGATLLLGMMLPDARPIVLAAAVLAAPVYLLNAFAFSARNTSWRGIHFAFSAPRGDAFKAIAPLLAWPAAEAVAQVAARHVTDPGNVALLMTLPYLVFSVVFPFVVLAMLHLRLRGTRYGATCLHLDIPLHEFRRVQFRGLGWFSVKLAVGAVLVLIVLAIVGDPDWFALAYSWLLFVVASATVGLLRARRFNLAVHRLVGDGGVRVRSALAPERLGRTYLVNALWTLVTLGIAAPWRRVVTRRLRAANLAVFHEAEEASFLGAPAAGTAAFGEALAEGLDLDLSL